MKYILDTNVCIKILNGSNKNILNKISKISSNDILIPSIVRFELYYGAYKSKISIKTLNVLNDFLNSFETLKFDDNVAETAGKLRADLAAKGTPIGPYDIIIAATAVHSNLTLITHNIKEFSRIMSLKIEDWEVFLP